MNPGKSQPGHPVAVRQPTAVKTGEGAYGSLNETERAFLRTPLTSVWTEDFRQQSFEPTRWSSCYKSTMCTNLANGEYQWYQPQNVTVTDGLLSLTAQREQVTREVLAGDWRSFPYTSGMLNNARSMGMTEGRMEVRAKVPEGERLWPAIWMGSNDDVWPPEIDLLETGGGPTDYSQAFHYGTVADHRRMQHIGKLPDLTTAFHTFAVQWDADRVIFMIDGVVTAISRTGTGGKPMHLMLNLAVGGDSMGPPTAATPDRASFDIDWVAAYGLG